MKKQVGLKFEESDLVKWDAFAEARGFSRTQLVERAVERFMEAPAAVAVSTAVVVSAPGRPVSVLPGNRDVLELGWYRPTSVEAKRGVKVDLELLKAAGGR